MTRKQRRTALIAGGLAVLAIAAGLVLTALEDTIVFFYSPTDIAEKGIEPGQRLRIGGLVAAGSVEKDGMNVRFAVTDLQRSMQVSYTGILPDLFREGQGVVAEGVMQPDGLFVAQTVLAKHDENYMPREVVDALKKSGKWKEGDPLP